LQWRAEQSRCLEDITFHQAADQSYLEEGARLLDFASCAQKLFEKQEPGEKRRMLNFVLSNSTWKSNELSVTFRQPFNLIAETAAIAAGKKMLRWATYPQTAWFGSRSWRRIEHYCSR